MASDLDLYLDSDLDFNLDFDWISIWIWIWIWTEVTAMSRGEEGPGGPPGVSYDPGTRPPEPKITP